MRRLGGISKIWTAEGADGTRPDPVDYDSLHFDVELVEGQWWQPDNDSYAFTEATVKSAEVSGHAPGGDVYPDGKAAARVTADYEIDSGACDTVAAFGPSNLLYNEDSDIIGGSPSVDMKDSATYAPGSNQDSNWAGYAPEGDVTVKGFAYAAPMER